MYDSFSDTYDRFVNWQERLAGELPFLLEQLREAGARRVLDTACGTGRHAIALAQAGFEAAGADSSVGMIRRARENARSAGVRVRFEPAGFGALEDTFGQGACDAVLCLGNSLPHLLSRDQLVVALADFAACLQPGGLVILQNRNFDAVMRSRMRWMEPQSNREGDREWIFLRFYDFEADGCIRFHILSLEREGEGDWKQSVRSTLLRPLPRDELVEALQEAGFPRFACYGDMAGHPFEPESSGNLVICAWRE